MKKEWDIGGRLRSLRMERRMSQEALALTAGISPAYLGMIERGQKNPTVRVLEDLCEALSISLAEFFRTDGMPEKEADCWTMEILRFLDQRTPAEKEFLYRIIQVSCSLRDLQKP